MNNYLILENRPELTSGQILGGMNFSAIIAGAASATADVLGGRSFGTGFISKGFLAVLIVVGGLAVYKNYTTYKDESSLYSGSTEYDNVLIRDKSKGPVLVMETIPPKNNKFSQVPPNGACQGQDENGSGNMNHMTSSNGPHLPLANIDSLIAVEDAMKAAGTLTKSPVAGQMVQAPEQLTCKKANEKLVNGMTEEPKIYNTTSPFNGSPNAKSYLWKPASFNHEVESLPGDFKSDCNLCDYNFVPGAKLDNNNYVGVWMHVARGKKSKFNLESGLKNISLIRTENGKSVAIHPVAIAIGAPQWTGKEWAYISNKFRATSAIYRFGDHIDIYMIFEAAKAGDKLVIDDFVETLVVK